MDDRRPMVPPRRSQARSGGYASWIDAAEPRSFDLDSQRDAGTRLEGHPLISVLVPVYRVPLEFLAAALDSLSAQTYPHWEACLACADPDDAEIPRLLAARQQADARVRIVKLDVNDGISAATNAALAAAQGEFANQHLEDGARQQVLGRGLRQPLADRAGRWVAGGQGVAAEGQPQGERESGSDELQLHGRLSVWICASLRFGTHRIE